VFSGAINVLYLTGSFFMLEIYDRVLSSRSLPTLVGICVIALLYAFQGFIDIVRSRLPMRVAIGLDEAVSARVFQAAAVLPLKAAEQRGVRP
jgi:ATP-binding cassette subfamily C protein PrsD